ncbi:hypothetical protein [Ectobacillus panaciterrae]|uniref:hypothetical protein n=1 Tax=Ectobacillus panaciterrae TaxID=363872 RepID=UPI000405B91C|nr:hypothetical protein [Ectobacillus panaciterrae]
MKKRLVSVLCFAGALALTVSIGFAKDNSFQDVKVSTQSEDHIGPVKVQNKDRLLVITREEQEAVESSSVKAGFLVREDGTKIFFEKTSNN